jgi:hypothetical protein
MPEQDNSESFAARTRWWSARGFGSVAAHSATRRAPPSECILLSGAQLLASPDRQSMMSRRTLPNARVTALVFGIVPCALGVGLGQYLRWSGAVWLTDAGGFWPIFCLIASLLSGLYLLLTRVYERTPRISAWLMLTWSWLYVPFWLTAVELPRTSALIAGDGRVLIVGDVVRPGGERAWLFAGRGRNRIIRSVEGTATINAVDVQYKFAPSYIASCRDEDDLSRPLVDALTAALATEATKPRSSRIAVFEAKDAQSQFLAGVCRAVMGSESPCPLKLTITPNPAATPPGGLWSKHFSEQEAIDGRHLPTLINLLTQDDARLTRKDAVYTLFMELAVTGADLAKVARTPHLLDDREFDALIGRILAAPDAGNEALSLYAWVTRLNPEQRGALRARAFREAGLASLIKQHGPGRITDSELGDLSNRLRHEFTASPDVAILALEAFGERLPPNLQASAVDGVARGNASQALAALRHLDVASPLRAVLVKKVIGEAGLKDLEGKLSQGKLEELLTPAEARAVVASIIAKAGSSREWLDFAMRVVPARVMTAVERKVIVDELMFSSLKSALEFVSANRQFLDASDVSDVTRDYARTIAPDFCLHLTHRNANRHTEYFSEAQLEIFRKCAQVK